MRRGSPEEKNGNGRFSWRGNGRTLGGIIAGVVIVFVAYIETSTKDRYHATDAQRDQRRIEERFQANAEWHERMAERIAGMEARLEAYEEELIEHRGDIRSLRSENDQLHKLIRDKEVQHNRQHYPYNDL